MISANDLRALSIFQGVRPKSLESLAKEMKEAVVEKGDIVIREGGQTNSIYFLASGRVSIEKRNQIVARLGPEEFFGEMAFLEKRPHSATVRALQKSRLFVLNRDSLERLFQSDSRLALQDVLTLFSGISRRLRTTTHELVSILHMVGELTVSVNERELLERIFEECRKALPSEARLGYYRWDSLALNYRLVHSSSPDQPFPAALPEGCELFQPGEEGVVEIADISKNKGSLSPFAVEKGQLVLMRVDWEGRRRGIFAAYAGRPSVLTSSDLQLMEAMASLIDQRTLVDDAHSVAPAHKGGRRRRKREER